ncbi:MAG: hypothetical protein QME58_07030 [Bacteroidota bacterium]|nr:hypothetical protein [Bacteroidota bacterium]
MNIVQELEKIESEIHNLKVKIKAQPKPIKLEGIWKGLEITEEDIENAKKSLFKVAHEFENE